MICRLAEMACCGSSIQVFKNAVLSAPISFLALASLGQALRFTCLAAAAASPATETGAGGVAAGGVAAGGLATGAAGDGAEAAGAADCGVTG